MISKSQYIRTLQCPKSLWLYKKRPELRVTEDKKVLFERGYEVGNLAKELFDGGVKIEFNPNDFNGIIEKTKGLLEKENIIYEAPFSENGIFAMADILVRDGDGWNIYEVKSSTNVKDYHIDDASIQWYAVSKAINLKKAFIVHINNEYERNGELEIDKLFKIVDITDKVLEKQSEIPENLKEIEKILVLNEEPQISIGLHCFNPFECEFIHYCWKNIPEICF
jgi:predicted RecB family nuclease